MDNKECPGCGKDSLVEHGKETLVCLNEDCREVISEDIEL